MNKKGFTLVELLSTIIIISLISGIGVVAYNNFIKEGSDAVFESYENSMRSEAIYYITNHYSEITFVDNKVTFTPAYLKMDAINNPKNSNDKCPNSYVEATRTYVNNRPVISYKVCLICNDYNSDGSKCKTYGS